MGVSGCGKTCVGEHLGQKLRIPFVDGDDLHPPENVARMASGVKLDDEARKPWLERICECAESHFAAGEPVVIACSALKSKYRDQLRTVSSPTIFLFLNGPRQVIDSRMQDRPEHFMPVELLESQFAELEDPLGEQDVVPINIDQPLESMLRRSVEVTGEQLRKIG